MDPRYGNVFAWRIRSRTFRLFQLLILNEYAAHCAVARHYLGLVDVDEYAVFTAIYTAGTSYSQHYAYSVHVKTAARMPLPRNGVSPDEQRSERRFKICSTLTLCRRNKQTNAVCDATGNGSCRVVCEWGSGRAGECERCRRIAVYSCGIKWLRWLSLLCRIVRGSFQETTPRKTAENTVKLRDGGVGLMVPSQPPRWRWKFGGHNNTTVNEWHRRTWHWMNI